MKTRSKALLLSVCAVLLVAASALGTMAYLTDRDSVVNTFTVGTVEIKLDEAKANPDGTPVAGADRVQANSYKLIPGHTYSKDPTVTVEAGSEEAYVRMMVTFSFASQLDAIFAPSGANLTAIFEEYTPENWALNGVVKDENTNTRTYEFRYVGAENQGNKAGTVKKADSEIVLDALFDGFTIPGTVTKEQLATLVTKDENGKITDQFTITVVAHAIQADGFADADAAWTAFGTQNP